MQKPYNLDMILEEKLDEFHFIELMGVEEKIQDCIDFSIRVLLFNYLESELLEEMTEKLKIDLKIITKI